MLKFVYLCMLWIWIDNLNICILWLSNVYSGNSSHSESGHQMQWRQRHSRRSAENLTYHSRGKVEEYTETCMWWQISQVGDVLLIGAWSWCPLSLPSLLYRGAFPRSKGLVIDFFWLAYDMHRESILFWLTGNLKPVLCMFSWVCYTVNNNENWRSK